MPCSGHAPAKQGRYMNKARERFLIISIVVLVIFTAGFFAYRLYRKHIKRNAAPLISCASDEMRISVATPREDLLIGVTAMDAEDGDLTDKIVIESISKFVEKGKCTITYAVCDSGNKVSTASRTIYYTDYHSPRFSLLSDFVYSVGSVVNPLSRIRAYDCIDGDITNRISMTTVDSGEFSSGDAHEVEFRVINSFGDVATFRANIVVEERVSPNVPVITLSQYLIYIDRDELIDPLDYVEGIYLLRESYTIDEYGRDNLIADTSGFDPSTPGLYEIPIYLEVNNYLGSTTLYVIVED